MLVNLALGAAFFAAAYWCWPTGITEMPFAALTLGHLLMAGGSVLLVLFGFAGLWKAIEDPLA